MFNAVRSMIYIILYLRLTQQPIFIIHIERNNSNLQQLVIQMWLTVYTISHVTYVMVTKDNFVDINKQVVAIPKDSDDTVLYKRGLNNLIMSVLLKRVVLYDCHTRDKVVVPFLHGNELSSIYVIS